MHGLFAALTIAASLLANPAGFSGRALAADENGVWASRADITCVEFLKRDKDEAAARARVVNPGDNLWTGPYTAAYYYILGFVSGVNLEKKDVADVFQRYESGTIIELIKRQCDRRPTDAVSQAILLTMQDNKSNWQLKGPAPNQPSNQTSPLR